MLPFRPGVTVAAIVERDGRFLFVHEQTASGDRLNQPAGHLDPGESLEQAVVRETLEESAWHVKPVSLVGVYLSRYQHRQVDVTYLRFAFVCEPVSHEPERALDEGILQALWLTPDELAARHAEHRSPQVSQCLQDYLAGRRFDLDMLTTQRAVFDGIGAGVKPNG